MAEPIVPEHLAMDCQQELALYFDRLWPLLRSLTGEGLRQTLGILSEIVPLQLREVPSGTKVFDWTVPKEWVVRQAYVIDPNGQRILDVKDNNLHLINYSIGYHGRVQKAELERHLHSQPDLPEAIPYVTSYYEPRWGFCLSENQRRSLPEGEYQIVIDADHIDGAMTLAEAILPGDEPQEVLITTYTCHPSLAEAILPGDEPQEVLITTYTCHPSLANNELSGPLVSAFLYRRLATLEHRRLTYRFAFVPETIGTLAYLATHGERFKKNLVAGYVLTCIGDRGPLRYKRSRAGETLADRAAVYVLSRGGASPLVMDFVPLGSDERQYGSPGFNLPVGSLMRTMYGTYPEYHTSRDDRTFVSL